MRVSVLCSVRRPAVRWVPEAAFRPASPRRQSLFCAPRRSYNYDPNGSRPRQQQQQQRIFKAVPVSPRDVPPRSSFDSRAFPDGFGFPGSPPPPPPPPPLRHGSLLRRTMHSTSMRTVVIVAAVGALLFYFTHQEVVPVSGRRRFNCFGEDTMRMLGDMQYEELMEEAKKQHQRFLPDYDPRTIIVRHVMRRLIPVSGMANNEGDWEICVIDDPHTANAFVLPGGKVFVYSGIFNIARNEDAVAAVLGHELAHNLANHHGERASSAIGSTILLTSAFLLTGGLAYFVLRPVIDLVFNSPMSRLQESEADYIGLMLMAEACFDPAQAADFWRRMDQAQQVQPPEWISTHPSEWLPMAMEKRRQSACDGTQDFAERFKRALRNGILLGV
ncbi:GPI anchored peptidase m48 [Niveomyces insectorum RCEF 264]|uniref:GPI anchored peptidase m48 n=1 Tax=Niveomyces insectorum RCEF 264 TaxID=1081102 RepID=A0A162JF40_9HYPO|nr:GPI anchored peptidase m48 [Niveomyces insectorum RCEF 264]